MYKCESPTHNPFRSGSRQRAHYSKPTRVAVETRRKQYDNGTVGREIVKELNLCTECAEDVRRLEAKAAELYAQTSEGIADGEKLAQRDKLRNQILRRDRGGRTEAGYVS